MRHLTYLVLLVGCLVATLPLELLLGARVYRQARRAASAVLPVAAVFVVWDVLAIRAGWWTYDPAYLVGLDVFERLPLEELLFFLVVPVCALLTFEAVRRLRPNWAVSSEDVPVLLADGAVLPADAAVSAPDGPASSADGAPAVGRPPR